TSDALERLGAAGAVPMGGGTDLLVAIEEEIARPEIVVDVRALPDGRGGTIRLMEDGGLRIDASVPIAALARDAIIRDRFPMLASACEAVATPALRNMGTLGGNLC